jgi:hypothetical protein
MPLFVKRDFVVQDFVRFPITTAVLCAGFFFFLSPASGSSRGDRTRIQSFIVPPIGVVAGNNSIRCPGQFAGSGSPVAVSIKSQLVRLTTNPFFWPAKDNTNFSFSLPLVSLRFSSVVSEMVTTSGRPLRSAAFMNRDAKYFSLADMGSAPIAVSVAANW